MLLWGRKKGQQEGDLWGVGGLMGNFAAVRGVSEPRGKGLESGLEVPPIGVAKHLEVVVLKTNTSRKEVNPTTSPKKTWLCEPWHFGISWDRSRGVINAQFVMRDQA